MNLLVVVVEDEAAEGARDPSFNHEYDECSFPNFGQSAPVFSWYLCSTCWIKKKKLLNLNRQKKRDEIFRLTRESKVSRRKAALRCTNLASTDFNLSDLNWRTRGLVISWGGRRRKKRCLLLGRCGEGVRGRRWPSFRLRGPWRKVDQFSILPGFYVHRIGYICYIQL